MTRAGDAEGGDPKTGGMEERRGTALPTPPPTLGFWGARPCWGLLTRTGRL